MQIEFAVRIATFTKRTIILYSAFSKFNVAALRAAFPFVPWGSRLLSELKEAVPPVENKIGRDY